jgi:hypothetical protein
VSLGERETGIAVETHGRASRAASRRPAISHRRGDARPCVSTAMGDDGRQRWAMMGDGGKGKNARSRRPGQTMRRNFYDYLPNL